MQDNSLVEPLRTVQQVIVVRQRLSTPRRELAVHNLQIVEVMQVLDYGIIAMVVDYNNPAFRVLRIDRVTALIPSNVMRFAQHTSQYYKADALRCRHSKLLIGETMTRMIIAHDMR